MLDGAVEVITTLIKETQVREEWRLYEEAREVATKQREVIERHFRSFYLADFKRRSDSARKIGQPLDVADYSLDELELVGEDDLDETLKFNDMANKLRAYCEEELTALDQRVGVLLGDAGLQAKDNPFSPQVICDAFKLACRQLDCELNVRRVFLKLFDDHVLDDIRSVYKAVNALLVRNSILPKIRYNVARTREGGAQPFGSPEGAEVLAAMQGGEVAQNVFSMLQNLVARSAVPGVIAPRGGNVAAPSGGPAGDVAAGVGDVSAGAASGGMAGNVPVGVGVLAGGAVAMPGPGGPTVILQGAELIGALTRIQRGDTTDVPDAAVALPADGTSVTNVLHQLKASSVGAGMNQLDAMTLDIIAMLFDVLFDDPKVPNGVKGLIGRLQIPILKVAISDKTFFSTKAHAARRLLDTVGEVALRLPADFSNESAAFSRLQEIFQSVVDGFQEDLEVFNSAREQLVAIITEEDQNTERQNQVAAKYAEEMEHLALARSAAQQEVQNRIKAHKLPQAVAEFFAQQWLKLLIVLHVKEGAESAAFKDALGLMDQLIWSIEPKCTTDERRKLAKMLPEMVKQVTAGLKTGGVEDGVRVRFFNELMQFHAQAISAVAQAAQVPPAAPAAVAGGPAVQPRAVPVTAMAATVAGQSNASGDASLDFTAPITVKNPFGDGEVEVESVDLDFTAEAEQGAKAKREASIRRALDSLKTGQWVEFRDPADKSVRRVGKLIFVSPRKSRYLFTVGRAGKEVIQCTRGEISRRFRAGEAFRLDAPPEESFFDRIMSVLIGKLRTPMRMPLMAQ
jgi:hypothetical protein